MPKSGISSPAFNELLRYEREQRDWTQEFVAARLGELVGKIVDSRTVKRWEYGEASPSPTYQGALKQLFGKGKEQLGWPDDNKISYWKVDYDRSPFFTGRKDILNELHDRLIELRSQNPPRPPALVGLGGVGKTQIAVEYAHLHLRDYHTVILLHAESYEKLSVEFASIGRLLGLPEAKYEQDQGEIIAAVMKWLIYPQITKWLLIFDGADDPKVVRDFIPDPCRGHIIITSRSQATGEFARSVEVNAMSATEGANFLLQRAMLIECGTPQEDIPRADYKVARHISTLLGGLPLALDQAGAYIDETGCSLSTYPEHYQARTKLLLQRRGDQSRTHNVPVAITWSLAFDKIRESNSAAVELLYLFSFLAPHGIPEEIILEGVSGLGLNLQSLIGDSVAFNLALSELRRYSLIRRDKVAKTCSLHPLVQTVVKEGLSTEAQKQWAQWAVQSVNAIVPDDDLELIGHDRKYFPHMQVCATLIETWQMESVEAAEIINKLVNYYHHYGQYAQAMPLARKVLTLFENALGPTHIKVAKGLGDLASIYHSQGDYVEAERYYTQAISLLEETSRVSAEDIGEVLNSLGMVYDEMGRYEEAEALLLHVIALYKSEYKDLSSGALISYAFACNNLGNVYQNLGKRKQATQYYRDAIALGREVLGEQHSDLAVWYNNLAVSMDREGKYEEAEKLYMHALNIYKDTLGSSHHLVATAFNNLGALYFTQERYKEAKPLFDKALAIRRKTFGKKHYLVAQSINKVARIYREYGDFKKAESLFKRAVTLTKSSLGSEHPWVGTWMNDLGKLYHKWGKYEAAERHYQQAINVWKAGSLPPNHILILGGNNDLGALYFDQGKYEDARPLLSQVFLIGSEELVNYSDRVLYKKRYEALLSVIGSKGDIETQGGI